HKTGGYTALWPIFNIADASIFVGVGIILIFQKRFFDEENEEHGEKEDQVQKQFIDEK
ncbi:MAG: lipoprotein signal peptidase, partial [Cytophagales bacterium]|nr:lipoprotein signal peptidase [Cytophagales bacterium]